MENVKKLACEAAERLKGQSVFPTDDDFDRLIELLGEDELMSQLEQYIRVFSDTYRERALELRRSR